MNVEMAWTETVAAIGRDLAQVRQHPVVEAIDVKRAGVLRLGGLGIVAARHHQDRLVPRRCTDLVEVDAFLKIVGLAHLVADAAVALDAMHSDARREIIGHQHEFAGAVDADMDRPVFQPHHFAMGAEFAGGGDRERPRDDADRAQIPDRG